ncbi:hypothetical protein LUZ60_015123 [Juncus effusus]|nr:hypothetical protein LUZ60_015123 [Juncus effusus]
MDRRSWPWKKKSSEKPSNTESSPIKEPDQEKETVNYIQVSPETYARLNELEKEVNVLNEKLTTAQTELTTKETLVKQHAKVAEEAVEGWEKAESEANALKIQLETVTLSKLSSDERAAHLDAALKECMKQNRLIKEESEQKLHDTVFTKTKQIEKLKQEFEYRIQEFEQELLRAKGENSALTRSLHERSNLIMQINDEKSQLEAEIEVLKSGIQNSEREINTLKYELHLMSKELEIRNEEKNMSVRSADVANRMHSEDLKKITKLEAECQRLRGLVRKKLPGPAALAQMKMEVESLGGYTRSTVDPARRPGAPHQHEHQVHHMQKENEFLTNRLIAMEEETKMLKEALSKRNTELQVTRNNCAKSVNKLRNMEVMMLNNNNNSSRGANGGNISNIEVRFEGDSNPPSLTSMSEDGDEAESWGNNLKGHFVNNNNINNSFGNINSNNNGNGAKSEGSSHLELMDDFLEMEKLACEENKSKPNPNPNPNPNSVSSPLSVSSSRSDAESASPISKLKSRVISLFDSQGQEGDIGTIIESIKCALKDVQNENNSTNNGAGTDEQEELKSALSQIRDFVISLGKEASEIHGRSSDSCQKLCTEIDAFEVSVEKALDTEKGIFDFLVKLSHVLNETNNINLNSNEGENNTLDCVDKVTLSENKVIRIEENYNNNNNNSKNDNNNNNNEEEIEKLKEEKKILKEELGKCNEKLQTAQLELEESKKGLTEIKSKLEESKKVNGLTETQLKCMAESYNSLEKCKIELESEIIGLREKIEGLSEELRREKESHDEDLVKFKELQEQIERNEKDAMNVDTEEDIKAKQEREIASAAEKLAECQETILFLGRQLQSLRPPYETKHRKFTDDLSSLLSANNISTNGHIGSETPMLNGYGSNSETSGLNIPKSPLSSGSGNNSKRPKHRSPRSSWTSSFRFLSKGKSEN